MPRAVVVPALLRTAEAASYLGISVKLLRQLMDQGMLPWIDVSAGGTRRALRFDRADLDAFMDAKRRMDEGSLQPLVKPAGALARRMKVEAIVARAQPTAKEAAALRRRPSFVYFFRSGPFVKIGTTRNLKHRLQNVQTSHPTPLVLIGSVKGDKRLERELHRRFASLRVNGEWFREVHELAVYIANLGAE